MRPSKNMSVLALYFDAWWLLALFPFFDDFQCFGVLFIHFSGQPTLLKLLIVIVTIFSSFIGLNQMSAQGGPPQNGGGYSVYGNYI